MVEAHFGGIRARIIDLLETAETSIDVGMAWFTNEAIFTTLLNKAAAGIKAKVLISDSLTNFRLHDTGKMKIDFGRLQKKGGEVRVVTTNGNAFFHNKFFILDAKRVGTGSYNWSSGAERNHENLVVTDDPTVVRYFSKKHEDIFLNSEASISYERFITSGIVKLSESSIDGEMQDDQAYHLAEEFEGLVQEHMQEGQRLGVKVNFDRLKQKIDRYTAVGAAKELSNKEPQTGFIELAAIHKLSLSFECLVVNPRFAILFDKGTIRRAEEKLRAYGWDGTF